MKFAMIAALALVSLNSFAALPTAADSWTKIKAAKLNITQPVYSNNFGNDGFFNACVDGAVLRTVKPIETCLNGHTERAGGEGSNDFVCDSYGLKDTVLPIAQNVLSCTEYQRQGEGGGSECVNYEVVTTNISLKPVFVVSQTINNGGGQDAALDETTILFSKTYAIPACAK